MDSFKLDTHAMGVTVGPHGMINHSYDPGLIVLSYIVSLTGCWTSLELLHRRTGARGYYNWYLLLAAACSMGPVAIWSMHFIGNRAIVMDKGQKEAQIQYSPGFTAASFFVPTVVVGIAFYFFSITEKVNVVGTAIGGFLTGVAVCGMHYMGQGGISNYAPSYIWQYIVGSAAVAVVTSTIALGAFFYFRSVWTNSWWKRGLCASLLALAVSSMHWIATVGTVYHLKGTHQVETVAGLSRRATVIVVMCLSMGCCSALITFAFIGQRSRQRSADRAQQVVLACATFDPEGRLMVTPEGLLPCRKITDSYIERSFEDVFDVDHPVFCWIYRASRCWRSVADVLPGIRNHLRYSVPKEPFSPFSPCDSSGADTSSDVGSMNDYSKLFKELFLVAAKDLADLIQEPLEDIGVLFGRIMSTGTLSRAAKLKLHGLRLGKNALDSAERGESPTVFGRGQLLFVLRRANRSESSRLQAAGHRFAAIPNVVETLARSMEVTREELLPHLENMRSSALEEHVLESGVHLASFALRPVFHRGFDVVVRKDASNLLPTTFLQKSALEEWQIDLIQRMDNLTVTTCRDLLREKRMLVDQREHRFADDLLEGISKLADTMCSPYFSEARLVARPLTAPCNPFKKHGVLQHAVLITFRSIVDAHQPGCMNVGHQFEPLKFFLCQQHSYKDSPDNEVFARKIHREFAALTKPSGSYYHRMSTDRPNQYRRRSSSESVATAVDRTPTPSPTKKKPWPSLINLKGSDVRDDNSSEKNLVKLGLVRPYGGIHVANEIAVDISEARHGADGADIEMRQLGVASEVGTDDTEPDSFADELVAITIDDRKKQRTAGF